MNRWFLRAYNWADRHLVALFSSILVGFLTYRLVTTPGSISGSVLFWLGVVLWMIPVPSVVYVGYRLRNRPKSPRLTVRAKLAIVAIGGIFVAPVISIFLVYYFRLFTPFYDALLYYAPLDGELAGILVSIILSIIFWKDEQ